ncbi:MAG: ribonuclease J [Clostridiales bacterium]|nr:ribonuclease J [Clostridiales bacterium]
MKNKNSLKVRFLGGVGEIGKNMTALEFQKDIIIIDAGLTFPSQDMPGIDLVIPDVTYIIQNKDRIKGLFLTHGHEDHIGGVPYLLKELDIPVYGTKLTLTLLENKLKEQGVKSAKLFAVAPKTVIKAGCFSVEFINVNHSIAGAVALAITTPVGIVFHSGDFKVDLTPIGGDIIDLARLTEIGKRKVLLMLCESTNVERSGYSMSESVVYENLERLFLENKHRRLIVATFASNVYRIQQILNLAEKNKRKVALSGRSMISVIEAARSIGELSVPKDVIVDIDRIKNIPDKELVVISTGSQGEPMSALTRMASGESKDVIIGRNDTIIISASPIPGNEKNIYQVINNLYRKGAEVVYESLEKIHASGHACQEELKIMHSLIRPKFFIPVHGEYRHLIKHVELAKEMGLKDHQALICDIGDTVEFTQKTMRRGEKFPSGSRLVDGLSVGEAPSVVRDRRYISEEGLVVAVVCVSAESGLILQEPDLISKGAGLTEQHVAEMKGIILKILDNYNVKSAGDKTEIRNALRKKLRDYVYKKIKKNPMVLPIITEV